MSFRLSDRVKSLRCYTEPGCPRCDRENPISKSLSIRSSSGAAIYHTIGRVYRACLLRYSLSTNLHLHQTATQSNARLCPLSSSLSVKARINTMARTHPNFSPIQRSLFLITHRLCHPSIPRIIRPRLLLPLLLPNCV